ncbi:VENN motif pre-toxin domain-containing protein [Stenoxybacter acetivorans]|uniref:VENN motif pre-toxin domain-containing protein n=1 Tax=Stenoxybacter acetivorans TaxID=422441 RepID=UPI0006903502|nr:VENN motif pre-toxin domain-containing protein [Stenoxybacter acetivorans]
MPRLPSNRVFLRGDNGYQINVKGNTDLKGALITSVQSAEDNNKNRLNTGSLTFSDLYNHADYEGSSFGISGSGSMGGGEAPKEIGGMQLAQQGSNETSTNPQTGESKTKGEPKYSQAIGFGSDSGHESSTTHSGINTANITITDEAKQQELTGKTAEEIKQAIKTEVSTENYQEASGSLKNNFDKDRVQAELNLQRQVTQEFDSNTQAIRGEINRNRDSIVNALENPKLSAAERNELQQQLNQLDNLNLLVNSISAGLNAPTESLGGIAAATASPALIQQVGAYFKANAAKNKQDNGGRPEEGSAAHLAAHAILAAAVAAAGGNDPLSAGIAAAGTEAVIPVVSQWLFGTKDSSKLSAEQKETLSSIGGLIGAGVGAIGGGSTADVVSGSQAAQNAIDNNWGAFVNNFGGDNISRAVSAYQAARENGKNDEEATEAANAVLRGELPAHADISKAVAIGNVVIAGGAIIVTCPKCAVEVGKSVAGGVITSALIGEDYTTSNLIYDSTLGVFINTSTNKMIKWAGGKQIPPAVEKYLKTKGFVINSLMGEGVVKGIDDHSKEQVIFNSSEWLRNHNKKDRK